MYTLVEDTTVTAPARRFCSAVAKRIEYLLKENDGISSQVVLTGSAGNGIITQNDADKSFDFDYNISVVNGFQYDPGWLKNRVRLAFNQALREENTSVVTFVSQSEGPVGMLLSLVSRHKDVEDSTSVLSTKLMRLNGDQTGTLFHMDVAILTNRNGILHRLKHDKNTERYIWNIMGDIETVRKRGGAFTDAERSKLRKLYVDKKNLHADDPHFPSFKCYIEAVNELYFRTHRH